MYDITLSAGFVVIDTWVAESWDEVITLLNKIGPISGSRQITIHENED